MATELTISDISASGLGLSSPDDEVHKTSPYVLFELAGEEHKTKKEKKAGAEVSWEGETVGLKPKAGESLAVSVIHKRHLLSDVVIGKGTLTTAELGDNGPVEVQLSEPKSGTPAGVLRFTVSGNNNLGYPKTATIKGSAGDPPATQAGTAGFSGAGAEAHDPSGVKTGRDYGKDGSANTGRQGAGLGAGAAGLAAVGAGGAAAAHKSGDTVESSPTNTSSYGTGAGVGTGLGSASGGAGPNSATGTGLDSNTGTGAGLTSATGTGSAGTGAGLSSTTGTTAPANKTYTEAAKERAVAGAEVVTQKLQDLKVGIVGQEGAAKAESKDATGEPIVAGSAQASYVDKAKEGAAYLITKTQDALGYTKDRLVGTGAAGSPTSATTTQGTGTTLGDKASAAADTAGEKFSSSGNTSTI